MRQGNARGPTSVISPIPRVLQDHQAEPEQQVQEVPTGTPKHHIFSWRGTGGGP